MLTITFSPAEADLAERLQYDLHKANVSPSKPLLIVLVSAQSNTDSSVQHDVAAALRAGTAIVPVLVEDAPLPDPLATFPPVDFTDGYDLDELLARLVKEVPMTVRVRTRQLRASNRTTVLVILVLVLGMFALAVLTVGGGVIAFPEAEYDAVDTEVALTQFAVVGPTLELLQPHSTDESANFPATLQAAPTVIRPLLAVTATAAAQGTPGPGE